MKQMTYFSLRIVSILLFGRGLLLLEELYHGYMATYFETDEMIRMTYPSIVFICFSILLWVSARKLTAIFNNVQLQLLDGMNSEHLKGVIIHVVGILYVITTVPDFIMFIAQILMYMDLWGLGYISKVDTLLFIMHFTIGFAMVKKSSFVLNLMNRFIKPL
ncbi:hypothetical protein ACFFK0_19475 [Paenibacillus chartarius]|uniref:Uncharacterized protein n=1 Tax=Paenibacillus chartarius TaxID=747481 RepID=A0ABV6DPQ1_9BACL